jgi:hypothetical protein
MRLYIATTHRRRPRPRPRCRTGNTGSHHHAQLDNPFSCRPLDIHEPRDVDPGRKGSSGPVATVRARADWLKLNVRLSCASYSTEEVLPAGWEAGLRAAALLLFARPPAFAWPPLGGVGRGRAAPPGGSRAQAESSDVGPPQDDAGTVSLGMRLDRTERPGGARAILAFWQKAERSAGCTGAMGGWRRRRCSSSRDASSPSHHPAPRRRASLVGGGSGALRQKGKMSGDGHGLSFGRLRSRSRGSRRTSRSDAAPSRAPVPSSLWPQTSTASTRAVTRSNFPGLPPPLRPARHASLAQSPRPHPFHLPGGEVQREGRQHNVFCPPLHHSTRTLAAKYDGRWQATRPLTLNLPLSVLFWGIPFTSYGRRRCSDIPISIKSIARPPRDPHGHTYRAPLFSPLPRSQSRR